MLPKLDVSPRPIVAPSLVVTNRLLGCSQFELSQHLLGEAANNPTLQLVIARSCPRCGFPLNDEQVCPLCARRPVLPAWAGEQLQGPSDWEEGLAAPDDFRLPLLSEARLALEPADHALAEFLVAALDEHGLLSGQPVLPQRAERVLRVIQSLDPAGIAARDTAECFRLQLQRLDVPIPPAVHRLVERWPNLPEHLDALAGTLHVTPQELKQALSFMRAHLRPYPIVDSPETQPYRQVDVAMLLARDSGEIQVIVAPGPHVRASDDPAVVGETGLSPQDWHSFAQQGMLIERALGRRRQILGQVFTEIAHLQADFLLRGPSHHRAIRRAQVAQALGVHASTVGRAVSGKTVLIPSNQIIPAALFFERGVVIKRAIVDIVARETTPLSDEELRERLGQQGLVLARRTVAKYRAAAGVLPAHMRWDRP
jgi:RNA polymerase sigma-54 factor